MRLNVGVCACNPLQLPLFSTWFAKHLNMVFKGESILFCLNHLTYLDFILYNPMYCLANFTWYDPLKVLNKFSYIKFGFYKMCRRFRCFFPQPFKRYFVQSLRNGQLKKAFFLKRYLTFVLLTIFVIWFVYSRIPIILQTDPNYVMTLFRAGCGVLITLMHLIADYLDFSGRHLSHQCARERRSWTRHA